jgi:dTDP-4-amino-4,6-dideoxygalactose transaminase
LFADVGRSGSDFPETERAYSGLLSLPLYPGLSERDQDRVVEVLSQCIA